MPGPLLPVLGPLLPALLILAGLRRWPVAAGVCGFLMAMLLRFMLAAVPLEPTGAMEAQALFSGAEFAFSGRSLLLTEALREILVFAYSAAAFLFLLSALWPQGPDFVPAGLAALSPLALALQIQPFTFGILALLAATALMVPMIQGGRAGTTLASLRYLVLMALSLPAFLVAGWMLDSEQLVLGATIWRLMLVGFLLLLGSFPFHIWIRPLLDESRPLVAVFVLAIMQLAALAFVGRLLQLYPALQANSSFMTMLGGSGAAAALLCALLALNAREPQRLLAYLALADVGAVVLILSLGIEAMEILLAIIFLRFVSLTIAAVGLLLLQPEVAVARQGMVAPGAGSGRWGTILFAFGALSLAGFPLTVGFAGRWAAITLVTERSLWMGLILLLATASGGVGLLRLVAGQLQAAAAQEVVPAQRSLQVGTLVVLSAGLIVALFPQPLLNLAARLAAVF